MKITEADRQEIQNLVQEKARKLGVTIVECPAKPSDETFVATDGTECATESERFWYEKLKDIEPPRREMPADAICENEITFVTEDAENWIIPPYDSRKPPVIYPKEESTLYPLALVLKWGYRVVNVDRLNEMSKQAKEK